MADDLREKALEEVWLAYSYPPEGATVGEEIEALAQAIDAYLAAMRSRVCPGCGKHGLAGDRCGCSEGGRISPDAPGVAG